MKVKGKEHKPYKIVLPKEKLSGWITATVRFCQSPGGCSSFVSTLYITVICRYPQGSSTENSQQDNFFSTTLARLLWSFHLVQLEPPDVTVICALEPYVAAYNPANVQLCHLRYDPHVYVIASNACSWSRVQKISFSEWNSKWCHHQSFLYLLSGNSFILCSY